MRGEFSNPPTSRAFLTTIPETETKPPQMHAAPFVGCLRKPPFYDAPRPRQTCQTFRIGARHSPAPCRARCARSPTITPRRLPPPGAARGVAAEAAAANRPPAWFGLAAPPARRRLCAARRPRGRYAHVGSIYTGSQAPMHLHPRRGQCRNMGSHGSWRSAACHFAWFRVSRCSLWRGKEL